MWLWHKILCHVNFENMVKINRKKRESGLLNLKKLDNTLCKECQLGKMKKSSFSRKSYTYNYIMELVHIDLYGPTRVYSYYVDRYLYYLWMIIQG